MIHNKKRKLKKNFKKIGEIFFGKMKKSEKNNAGKCAIFFTKNPKVQKPTLLIYNCVCIAYSLFFALQNTKNRKNWIFSCFLCAHSKFIYETSLWCYVVLQNIFDAFLIRSGYLKFCSKKFFPEKKAIPQKFRGKFFWKKSKNPNIWPIGRNRPNIFWGQICGY